MPKAALPAAADEEKTTLESQWEEDEASTTVDQNGSVSEKIRELGLEALVPNRPVTGVTGTANSALEEPTVDDQHANPAIVDLVPPGAARMVITHGTDAGKSFDIDAAKSFTIGRGLDNDIVLSDIAVSRKHFDLRYEGGAWVIADRGSGNGTVVNGNLEDHPFMLANGDAIEIGNTTFRFEQQAADVQPSMPETFDVSLDEDLEPSTVAAKPYNQQKQQPHEPTPQPYAPPSRPKTLPPPMPLRTRPATLPPSKQQGFILSPPQPGPTTAASTMPLAQMSGRPPVLGNMPQGTISPSSFSVSMSFTGQPTNQPTITPMSAPPPMISAMAGMPPISAPMNAPTLLGGEPLGTTIPGHPAGPAPMQQLYYPQASEIPPHSVHALVVQAQNRRGDGTSMVQPQAYHHSAPMIARFAPPQLSRRMKIGIGLAGVTLVATITTLAIAHSSTRSTKTTASQQPTTTKATQPPPKAAPPTPPQTVAKQPEPPKPEPKVAAIAPTTHAPTKPVEAPRPEPKPIQRTEPRPEPRPEPKPVVVARRDPEPPAPRPEPTTAPKRTATADDARERADKLYQDKHFSDAASVLYAAAKSADASGAKELRLKAQRYASLAKSYNAGMAPGTDPEEAFDALRAATTYDQLLGGEFADDISDKMKKVVPLAAISFMASQELEKAHSAVISADQLGIGGNANVAAVRKKLEQEASSIYAQAHSAGFNTPDGKDKLRRIKSIVDSSSQWYQKANQALLGAG
ncbi:MAG TPA: FHA domain-containing protein [Kofleriaceae bacterium]